MKWYATSYKQFENAIMSESRIQVLQMLRTRQKLHERPDKLYTGPVQLQVLGNGALGEPRSLYVSCEHTKYLFNCGEGTQRLAFEHRYKLLKLNNIFFTTSTWNNMGGLPGVALTMQDTGISEILLHGPKGTSDIFDAIKKFVKLRDITLSEAMYNEHKPFVDNVMKVQYVLLTKTSKNDPIDNANYYRTNTNQKRSLSMAGSSKKLKFEQPRSAESQITDSMAYICKLHSCPGTLNLEKCIDKGVPAGPILGELKAGKDVTLPDGTVVKSKDVCLPECPGAVFIVIECPTEDYLDSLIMNPAFTKHQETASKEDIASCVIHFTPENVLNDTRYKNWMNKFAKSTYHMIINKQNEGVGSEAIHRMQYKLHLLHPKLFPLLSFSEEDLKKASDDEKKPEKESDDEKELKQISDNEKELDETSLQNNTARVNSHILRTKVLHSLRLRPDVYLDTTQELKLQPNNYINEVYEIDGLEDALTELQSNITAKTKLLGEMFEYPKIVILGTGSCIPNKTRNTSGILLRIDEGRSILLDCGEGTLSQLVRFYGKSKVGHILSSIKAIYVSHLHADHHIGLIGLLQERERFNKEPVFLLAPERISSWLTFYHERFESIRNFILIPNEDLILNNHTLKRDVKNKLYMLLKVLNISTVFVKHCPYAFGIAITHIDGRKIVYSGDTMPCESLIKLGYNSDLLIHEATMGDGLENEARIKLHSTITQAIKTGIKMETHFTLLTHFSQRYSKISLLPEYSDALKMDKVGLAYDYMEVSLSELPLLSLFYPVLRLMFNESYAILEDRALRRQLREQEA